MPVPSPGQARPARHRLKVLALAGLVGAGVALAAPAGAAPVADAAPVTTHLGGCRSAADGSQQISAAGLRQIENDIVAQTNTLRVQHGRAPLMRNTDIDRVAKSWSQTQADVNGMHHSERLGATRMPSGYKWTSEILAYAWGKNTKATKFMDLWIASTVHRNNLLNTAFTHHGVGVAMNARGCLFATQNFGVYPGSLAGDSGTAVGDTLVPPSDDAPAPPSTTKPPAPPSATKPPAPPSAAKPPAGDGTRFYLNDGWTTQANRTYPFGKITDEVFVGDWDGDGVDTLALRRGNVFHITNSADGSTQDAVIAFGHPGDVVLAGDWDGDGVDTLAVRRGQVYHFMDRIGTGPADRTVAYGKPADVVHVGDWNGDGVDTLTVRRGQVYLIADTLRTGPAERTVAYGRADDVVLVGDWDGNKTDTLTVRRGAHYLMKNTLTTGAADQTLVYGRSGDKVVVGDWNGDRKDTLGVRRGS